MPLQAKASRSEAKTTEPVPTSQRWASSLPQVFDTPYDTKLGGYVVDLGREQLEGAPSYGRDEAPWGDPAYGRGISDHYGVPPYV